jgi:hypothetical protein
LHQGIGDRLGDGLLDLVAGSAASEVGDRHGYTEASTTRFSSAMRLIAATISALE